MGRKATRNLVCTAGDDYDHEITVVDSNGAPVNVSTWTFAAKIKTDAGDPSPTSFSVDTTNASTGVIVLSLSDTVTLARAGANIWDAQRTIGSKTTTFMGGTFIIDPQVT